MYVCMHNIYILSLYIFIYFFIIYVHAPYLHNLDNKTYSIKPRQHHTAIQIGLH